MCKRSNVLLVFSEKVSSKILNNFTDSNNNFLNKNFEEYFQPNHYELDGQGNLLLYFSNITWHKKYEEINFLQNVLSELKNQPNEYLFAQKSFKDMQVKGNFFDAPFNFSIDDDDINLFIQKEPEPFF